MNKLSYALIVSFVLLAGCTTQSDDSLGNASNTESPYRFLARPRFERSTVRPLGRVLLNWNAVEGADGYELQSSETEDFAVIIGSWTISTTHIELPVASGTIVWFRVRSFDQDAASQWSSSLRVDERPL